MIKRGELPEKAIHEFSINELERIMQTRPTAILELFERSGWEIDDAGRETIARSLIEEVAKDKDISIEAKKAFKEMTALEKEVIIRYRAIVFTSIGSKVFEAMHHRDVDNPLKVPKFVEEFNYETLLLSITNPSDGIGLVFNTLNGQRVVTSLERAQRFYGDAFMVELASKKLKLKIHKTTIDAEETDEKLHITLVGHLYEGEHLAVSVNDLISEAAMDIVTEQLKNKIKNKFHQEDIPDEDKNNDNKQPKPNEKYSSPLKFPKWSDEEDNGEDEDDSEDFDDFFKSIT